MAYAVAEGARRPGATTDAKRVPENVPADIAKAFHFKLNQPSIATVDELANYDAIVVGAARRSSRAQDSICGAIGKARGPLASFVVE
jgi:NAD(P)H dehydrogenase (quinone)